MIDQFYSCLFDIGQHTCFGETPKSTRVSLVKGQQTKPYFTINALHPKYDLQPTEPYHSANKPRRADHNVVCFRNILIEMDTGSSDDQLTAIFQSNIPFSTCVSSGGKSLHFIISLKTALLDRLAYTDLVKRIYAGLLHRNVRVDIANKNPSRFSRAPGVQRPETGRLQELLAVYGRVDNELLNNWLSETLVPEPITPNVAGSKILYFPRETRIHASTERFLKYGAPNGEWNVSLFRAACNLFQTGASAHDVISQLQRVTGTLDSSDLATINSARKRVSPSLVS